LGVQTATVGPLVEHKPNYNSSHDMALTAGARFGTYEITSAIGAGGMGEVYRARDTRLKRDVAVKILPRAVAGDRDRVARFEREAEVLAALNHCKIAVRRMRLITIGARPPQKLMELAVRRVHPG
jgi:serine/threonine protein kinase